MQSKYCMFTDMLEQISTLCLQCEHTVCIKYNIFCFPLKVGHLRRLFSWPNDNMKKKKIDRHAFMYDEELGRVPCVVLSICLLL